jgi:hypothetical protein
MKVLCLPLSHLMLNTEWISFTDININEKDKLTRKTNALFRYTEQFNQPHIRIHSSTMQLQCMTSKDIHSFNIKLLNE